MTPTRLTLVPESGTRCGCREYPLWTDSRGYISTCRISEHFGQPLNAHPSLVVTK